MGPFRPIAINKFKEEIGKKSCSLMILTYLI